MTNDFLAAAELSALGLRHVGRDVLVSRHALLLGTGNISIGDFSRIDAFATLSAGDGAIEIGRYVHVGAYCALLGGAGVALGDYVSLSPRCSVFTANDDFGGDHLGGPTTPARFRQVHSAAVAIGRFAMVGSGSIVLPGVTIGESAAVGALSLVKDDVQPFAVVAGVPARRIGSRSKRHRDLARELESGAG